MIRKPSFAQMLVAAPRQLAPQKPSGAVVGIPSAPPASLRYGSIPPGIAQSSRYTGGVVQRQPAGQMYSPPDFLPPSYATPGASPLAALVSAATGFNGGFVPPRPPRRIPPGAPQVGPISPNFSGAGSPAGAPGPSGGFHISRGLSSGNPYSGASGYTSINPDYTPQQNTTVTNATNYTGGYTPLGALLAANATAGRRGLYYG